MTPKIGPNVAWQIVDGEAIVVDLASGTTIGLNPTGTFLWSQIDGGRDLDALAGALAANFEIGADAAGRDTREFFDEMSRRALVVDAGSAR
jgi:Coenzyme PQQ synthesis protein D (PqqD)